MDFEKKNYFVVSRNLLNSNRWLCQKFTRGQAWIDLFGLAQHTKSYFMVRGIKVEVERGQLGYSQLTLAQRWKWSRDKVRRYLKCLENDGDIIQQNNEITTIITIVNYDRWQLDNTTNKTPNNTTNKQQKNNRQYNKQDTYNNDNKDNKDNNDKNIVSGDKSPTPQQIAKEFFTNKEKQKEFLINLYKKYGENETLDRELQKFISYWTESNKSGTKQKWELQQTFEVGRRLATWLSRSSQFSGINNNKIKIGIL